MGGAADPCPKEAQVRRGGIIHGQIRNLSHRLPYTISVSKLLQCQGWPLVAVGFTSYEFPSLSLCGRLMLSGYPQAGVFHCDAD